MVKILLSLIIIGALAFGAYLFLAPQSSVSLSAYAPQLTETSNPKDIIEPSTLTMQARYPMSIIKDSLADTEKLSFRGGLDTPEFCQGANKLPSCTNKKYAFNVNINAFRIDSMSDNTIFASAPVTISNSKKHGQEFFQDSARLYADIILNVERNWCLKARTKSKVKMAKDLRTRLPQAQLDRIRKAVTRKLQGTVKQLGAQVATAINCEDIKKQVSELWATKNFPLQGVLNKPAFISLRGLDMGYTGLNLTPEYFLLNLSTKAAASITTRNGKPAEKDLHAKVIAGLSDKFITSIFYDVAYSGIEQQLQSEFLGKTFESITKYGNFTLSINGLQLYPSYSNRLAIAMDMKVNNSEEWFGKQGTVYIMAALSTDKSRTKLKLKHAGYSEGISKEIAEGIKRSEIITTINKQIIKDFKQPLSTAKDNINKALTNHKEHALSFNEPSMKIGKVFLRHDKIRVYGTFTSSKASMQSSIKIKEPVKSDIMQPVTPITGGAEKPADVIMLQSVPVPPKPAAPTPAR